MTNQPIILFDGVCNFCNGAVNFAIKRDKKRIIKFAPLQSSAGQQLLKQYDLPTATMDSFVFIDNNTAYTQSTAAIKVCSYLSGLWPLCKVFLIVPKFIRDGLYNWIAKNRYKWFGERESCMIPTPDVRARFLD
ncbi:thiol-disulfide oxidoreductase DCC family protein [Ferruginibacter sp. SUN002]|uniref:thiol-disulfide oxidoreductase DCC family protein n=1 Tax=Ferruginibacter sp. SUN002 TaxID=2937789 RepID=UPI003D36B293